MYIFLKCIISHKHEETMVSFKYSVDKWYSIRALKVHYITCLTQTLFLSNIDIPRDASESNSGLVSCPFGM